MSQPSVLNLSESQTSTHTASIEDANRRRWHHWRMFVFNDSCLKIISQITRSPTTRPINNQQPCTNIIVSQRNSSDVKVHPRWDIGVGFVLVGNSASFFGEGFGAAATLSRNLFSVLIHKWSKLVVCSENNSVDDFNSAFMSIRKNIGFLSHQSTINVFFWTIAHLFLLFV